MFETFVESYTCPCPSPLSASTPSSPDHARCPNRLVQKTRYARVSPQSREKPDRVHTFFGEITSDAWNHGEASKHVTDGGEMPVQVRGGEIEVGTLWSPFLCVCE